MTFKTNKISSRSIAAIFIVLIAMAVTNVFPQTEKSSDPEPANVLAAFSNTTPLNIPDNAGASSVINVSGMAGNISRLTVTLNGVFHVTPSDLDFLLIAPNGAQMVVMSDAGGNFPLSDSIVRLSDYNASPIPATSTIGNGLVDYKPTNYGSFDAFTGVSGFPPGAAPGGSSTLAGTFDGINPNGQWRLFVQDDTSGGNGANSRLLRGWSLKIETADNLVVTTFGDTNDGVCDSHCSLREAIAVASFGSTIRFSNNLIGATIVLSDTLDIDKSLKITAVDFNTSRVTISGNSVVNVISVFAGADVTLENVVIAGGRSRFFGAGIVNRGNLFLQNCIVRGNILRDPAGNLLSGAGIFSTGNLRLLMTTVEQNEIRDSGSGQGAAIFVGSQNGQPATLTMNLSIIRDNRILGNFEDTGNSGGGIALSGNASAVIVDSSITGNSSQDEGGAIFNDGGEVQLINSTVAQNVGLRGPALTVLSGGNAQIVNSTVARNFGFIGCSVAALSGEVTIRNSIVAANGCDVEFVTSAGTNLIGAAQNSTIHPSDLVTMANPGLGSLGSNGGVVPTIPLLSNSPAINGGNSCVLLPPNAGGCSPVQLFTDGRLLARNLGGSVDIGAVEFNLLPTGTLEPTGRRSLPAAILGQPYDQEIFAVVGGAATVAVTGFNIPGMTFAQSPSAASAITISGVPSVPGIYNFTVAVSDAAGYSVIGNYTLNVLVPTAASVTVAGRISADNGILQGRTRVTLTDSNGRIRTVSANSFGYFQFDDVAVGETYVVNAENKDYRFVPQIIFVDASRSDILIIGSGER